MSVLPLLLAGCSGVDFYEPNLDDLFADYEGNSIPGASVLVIQNGESVFHESYGMAVIDPSTKVRHETNFRLASVTKQFTAMSIMILVDRGDLEFETKLTEIFQPFPRYGDEITIRHLLQHNSGLQDYESLIPDSMERQVHDADVLTFLKSTDSTYFEPGSDYRYSNSGYAMLALIIEEISGFTFSNFLEANIFQPLGMDGSIAFVDGANSVDNRAFGYTVDEIGVSFSDQSQTSAVLGDGGIYSSTRDLLKWDQALYGEDLVPAELLNLAYTPGLSDYGFGVRIDSFQNHRRISHTGSTRGFRNVIQRFPDDNLTVIVLTNRNGPAVAPLAEQLAEHFLNQ